MKTIVLIMTMLFVFVGNVFAGTFYIPEGTCLRVMSDRVLQSVDKGTVPIVCEGRRYFVEVYGMDGQCRCGRVITSLGDTAQVSVCFQQRKRRRQYRQYYNIRRRYRPRRQYYGVGHRNNVSQQHHRQSLNVYKKPNDNYGIMDMPDDDFREYAVREDWRTDHHIPQIIRNFDDALDVDTRYGLGRVQEHALQTGSDIFDRAASRLLDKLFE